MAEQIPDKLPNDLAPSDAAKQPDVPPAFTFSPAIDSFDEKAEAKKRRLETAQNGTSVAPVGITGPSATTEQSEATEQVADAFSARITLPGTPRPEKPIVSDFPLYFELVDAQTGQVDITEAAYNELLTNSAFQNFIQSLPDFKSVQFASETGVEWIKRRMEIFVVKTAVLAELQTIFTKELQERFGLAAIFDDGDFGPLKEYIAKSAIENPRALKDLLSQALLYQAAEERRAVLEQRLGEQQIKYGDKNELRGELAALENKRATVHADREKMQTSFREVYHREAALKKAKKANDAAAVFGIGPSKLMDLKPLQFLDGANASGWRKKLAAIRPLHNISPEQEKAEQELSALYGRPVSVTEVDQLLLDVKAEKERIANDPAYKQTDVALAEIQKNIDVIQARVNSLDSAAAAKDQLAAGVTVARSVLFGEIAAFREIAKNVAREFSIQLVPGTAVPVGKNGAPSPEAASLMTRAEYISSLIEAGNAYTPEWVTTLDTALTDEKDRRIAATILRTISGSVTEQLQKEKNPTAKGALISRQVMIGAAMRALLPKGADALNPEKKEREAPELPKKEREALMATTADILKNVSLQSDSIVKGQNTYTAKGFEPLSLEAARIAESLMMKDLAQAAKNYERLGDAARLQALNARIGELKALFGELGPAEKRFAEMRMYDSSKELRQIPLGLPERIARVVQLLSKELA